MKAMKKPESCDKGCPKMDLHQCDSEVKKTCCGECDDVSDQIKKAMNKKPEPKKDTCVYDVETIDNHVAKAKAGKNDDSFDVKSAIKVMKQKIAGEEAELVKINEA